jgi:hypothetical protein
MRTALPAGLIIDAAAQNKCLFGHYALTYGLKKVQSLSSGVLNGRIDWVGIHAF